MWEIIQANKRKSLVLFFSLGACLIILGYLIGECFASSAGPLGLAIALFVWVILSFLGYFSGDSIILAFSQAKEAERNNYPQLFNIVDEMRIAANLYTLPKIYIMAEAAPNAFAVGAKPENSAIIVTAGLLSRLSRDELQGVIAHEISHILNRDVLFMTFAGITLGSIVLISDMFLRGFRYSGSSRRYRSKVSFKGNAQVILILAAVIFAILAPILARLFYFAISRKREYLADASAVRLTRYPEGLASALAKISSENLPLVAANKVTAAMYIVNPLELDAENPSSFMSTHPPASERIRILRSISGGANYRDYQKAFSLNKRLSNTVMPQTALSDRKNIPLREPSQEEPKTESPQEKARDVGDLMRSINGYAFLACACGLKIKLPANYDQAEVLCPRCARSLKTPLAEVTAAVSVVSEALSTGESQPQREINTYTKKGSGWETFLCICSRPITLSPLFCGTNVTCSACDRKIEIKSQL